MENWSSECFNNFPNILYLISDRARIEIKPPNIWKPLLSAKILHVILPLASTWFHSLLWASIMLIILIFVGGLHDNSYDLIQPNSLFKDILFWFIWLAEKCKLYFLWFVFFPVFLFFSTKVFLILRPIAHINF